MMSKFKTMLLAGTFALAPLAAHAQEAPVAEVVADETQGDVSSEAYAADAKAKMQKEMDAAIALVEKMFDTSSLPPRMKSPGTLVLMVTCRYTPWPAPYPTATPSALARPPTWRSTRRCTPRCRLTR